MVQIDISPEYGYVLATAVSTLFVQNWLGVRVGSYRKAAKIPYPYEYASYEQIQTASPASQKAMFAFNSAQRAHQNFGENHSSFLTALLISGLQYPKWAAGLGAVWAVNRVLYMVGYARGKENGSGRYLGGAWLPVQAVLYGFATKVVYNIIMA